MRLDSLAEFAARRSLTLVAAGVFLSAALASPLVRAADPTPAGSASIGSITGNQNWWGLWPTTFGGSVWNRYTIISSTDTNNTYVNAQPGGSILFRSNNMGPLNGDPDHSTALAWIDNNGVFHAAGLEARGPIDANADVNLWSGSLFVSTGKIDGRGSISGSVAPGGLFTTSPKGAVMGQNQFTTVDAFGVWGSGSGGGVKGETGGGTGVLGTSLSGAGLMGTSNSSYGLNASSSMGVGVYGASASSYAVQGVTGGSNYAGFFQGGTKGAYGKGTTYGVYSDGPLYVNSSSTTKASGSGTWSIGSDARIKKNVVDFQGGLADLEKVRPVRFQYNGLGESVNDGSEFVGVIAQELELVAPYMVSKARRKLHPGDKEPTDIKQVDPNAFIYMLINSVKELARENRQLAQQNREVMAESTEVRRLLCASHRGESWCGKKMAVLRR